MEEEETPKKERTVREIWVNGRKVSQLEDEKEAISEIFNLPPEFYVFEIYNVFVLIIVGIGLIIITALDMVHVLLGVGLLALMAGFSSVASGANYMRTRSEKGLHGALVKSFRYRIVTGVICFIAGGALLMAYFIQ
jgi:hypothetical protein